MDNDFSSNDIKIEVDHIWNKIDELIKDRRDEKSFGPSVDFLIEGRIFSYLYSRHGLRCANTIAHYENIEKIKQGEIDAN